jgi:hypothetical protein
MYSWFNKHLRLGQAVPLVEEDFQPLTPAELTVWDAEHPKPPGGPDYERSLLRHITAESDKQMQAIIPRDAKSWDKFRKVIGKAVHVMIGRGLPPREAVKATNWREQERPGYRLATFFIRNEPAGEAVPAVMLSPKHESSEVVLWIDRYGKQALFDEQGEPRPAIVKLLAAGKRVVGIDLFGQGEFTSDGRPLDKQPLNRDGRGPWANYAGYTYGYNHSMFARRVHDILSAVAYLRSQAERPAVHLIGLEGAGHWVAAARAQAGEAVAKAAIDTGGFRFADVEAIDDADFLPGGAKYLDLPGMIALSAPGDLWLAGETDETSQAITAAYRAAGGTDRLTLHRGDAAETETAAVEWLLHSRPTKGRTPSM